jgi:hypothetical protein
MAGAGIKVFEAGQKLTANQVNTYLMDQAVAVFDDETARTNAFGGSGEPNLSEGRVCYLKSDDKVYVYTATGWTEIGAQIELNEITTDKINNGAVTTAKIAAGTILDSNISASAAITLSKLATGTQGTVVIHNSSGVPTATALSGDVTVTNAGVTAIGSSKVTSDMIVDGTIVNGDINTSAAIAYSKLNLATSVVNGDINNSAAIAYSKLNLATSIVNGDVSSSAAIAHSKLANATAGQVLLGTTTTGVITATSVTGDITINGAGVTAIGSGKVTSDMIVDGTIVNGDIATNAAIDQGKIADSTIDTKTANYVLALTDKNKFIEMNVGSANTVSVPTDASVNFPIGSQINITQYGTGKTQVIAVTPGTTSIRSTPGAFLRDRYSSATLIKRAANEWYLIGDLSAS